VTRDILAHTKPITKTRNWTFYLERKLQREKGFLAIEAENKRQKKFPTKRPQDYYLGVLY